MPKGSWKGGDFEREMCKLLSRWWTEGERDDVFWRSSQSGGRATQRAKSGKSTYGSYGDIAAVDPMGEPLLKFATIELKRGSSHGTPWDLVEAASSKAVRVFEGALNQAMRSAYQAKSMGWMIIARRDRKQAMVYLSWNLFKALERNYHSQVRFDIQVNSDEDWPRPVRFVAVRLEDWLASVKPPEIIQCLV